MPPHLHRPRPAHPECVKTLALTKQRKRKNKIRKHMMKVTHVKDVHGRKGTSANEKGKGKKIK
jgi:hypothetical protein